MIFKYFFSVFLILSANSYAQSSKFELGRSLFFDKLLSGNRNISCATCHHPLTANGDGLSLGFGEGGVGLGITRNFNDKVHGRVPRNAPALFNVGQSFVTKYFFDGRVEFDIEYPGGIKSPADNNLPEGLESLLAAQSIFPLTSGIEMAGDKGENDIADFASTGDHRGVWGVVVGRVKSIEEYVELFVNSFPNQIKTSADIQIHHVGNALADFQKKAFIADDSPFDRYLEGDKSSLSASQISGMNIFYGKGKCSQCHTGKYQTDMKFHSIALPPIGPGKGVGFNLQDDWGRYLVTKKKSDKYKFRTPSLRNVSVTAPYGHNGAYNSLEDILIHHMNPKQSLSRYKKSKAALPELKGANDFTVLSNNNVMNDILLSSNLPEINISKNETSDLLSFLTALTDFRCLDMRKFVPQKVPSGLPIND